jgi:uncharacterized protein involved in exopolysaccharide biosynthesis
MSSSNYFENEEKTINLAKVWRICAYRKRIILICFILTLSLCAVFTAVCPKVYLSEAKILINKNNSTYLSDINPFALSDSKSDGLMKLASQDNLGNEIEIIRSPLVLSNVIKENGLKYTNGAKAGRYLDVKDFLKKNFSVESLKNTDILKISYKSKDPALSYRVIKSILTNYKAIYENINIRKASSDKDFLLESYIKAKDNVESKIARLKEFKARTITPSDTALNNINILLSLQDKRINQEVSSLSQLGVENKKLEAELDQELENLKNLKSKYEWSKQIESMSKNATNLIILEEPKVSDILQYSEPKPLFNMFIALVFSVIVSYFVVLYKEKADKKLSYTDLGDDFRLIRTDADLFEIKIKTLLNNIRNLGIISLADKEFTDYFVELIKNNNADYLQNAIGRAESNGVARDNSVDNNIKIEVTSIECQLKEFLDVINSSDNLVFIGHIGNSDRKIYSNLKLSAEKLNKKIIGELVYEK